MAGSTSGPATYLEPGIRTTLSLYKSSVDVDSVSTHETASYMWRRLNLAQSLNDYKLGDIMPEYDCIRG